MSSRTLLFVTYARLLTGKLIFFVSGNPQLAESYKSEALKVVNQLIQIRLNPDERQKINSSHGNWFTTVDDKEIAYLVLTTSDYPERYAYEYAAKIREQLEKIGDYSNEDEATLKFNSKELTHDLFKRYADLKSLSQIDKAQSNVSEVKVQMSDNIGKMLDNQGKLQVLDEKSRNLSASSKQFEKQSKNLERVMYWRNLKLKIIIGLVFLGVFAYILLPIILKITKSSR